MARVILAVRDMISRVRISATAHQLGIETVPLRDRRDIDRLLEESGSAIVVIDLGDDRVEPFDLLRDLHSAQTTGKVQTIGFFSHVLISQKQEAKRNGCMQVLPRSEFFKRLPDLLAPSSARTNGCDGA